MAYSTISKPSLHFNTKTYAGNGSSNAQTGIGFQPDLFWCKSTTNAENHTLIDAVRGVNSGLGTNTTAAAHGSTNFGSFDSDGFTWSGNLGSGNENGQTYVAWNWKAGNSAGSSNTDGSITSTVSANTTAGFSIVKYTGTGSAATIGHGLGVAPALIILKADGTAGYEWFVFHKSLGATNRLKLNSTTNGSSSTFLNNTTPSTTVFNTEGGAASGESKSYIGYCFAEKKGFSKFGSYTGNGSTDGTFVYTGFKPAWVMIKGNATGNYYSWSIFDTTRQNFNVNAGKTLYANRDYQEGKRGQGTASTTIPAIDMLSNGFKCRVLNDEVNTSSGYIYMAFAEEPLVGSNNIPATAR
jgi:hypothetical protein